MAYLTAQVEGLCKQLVLLRGQSTKLEKQVVRDEDEVALFKQDLPNRFKDSIAEAVDMAAVLWSWSTLVTIFKEISKHIFKVDVNFPLNQLPCMNNILALQAREKPAEEPYRHASYSTFSSGRRTSTTTFPSFICAFSPERWRLS